MFYTKRELADYLKIGQHTLDRLVATGQLPVVKVGGACRYRDEDVETFIKARTVLRPSYDSEEVFPGVVYTPGMKVV